MLLRLLRYTIQLQSSPIYVTPSTGPRAKTEEVTMKIARRQIVQLAP